MIKTTRLLVAGAALLALSMPAVAGTLKWGASRDISSLDPYSYGDSFALATSWEIVSPTI